ncbi:MAG TPA: EAL domain-containing protein, partial [Burkholderiaceae bacterium]|nr:EAL domain-containing protein [Burkholderiaceae bacterium]
MANGRCSTAPPNDGCTRPPTFYDQSQSQQAKRLFLMEQYLRRDVAGGQLRIHLQPIVDLTSRRVLGYEALARWSCPSRRSAPRTRPACWTR